MTDRIRPITMPKWGMTMTEGKLAGWLKSEGEAVTKGEEIFEVETDKITNVVEADADGTLRRVVVTEGRSAPVGSLLAVMAGGDVGEEEIDAYLAGFVADEAGEGAASGLEAREIEAGGLRLRVVTAEGPADAAPAILLHGFGSDAAAWMFNQEALATARTVHAIELPSHGGSAVAAERSDVADLASVLAEAVDLLAPDAVHLVGHSLGGRLALRLAAGMGDRVTSLTLIAPAGLGEVNSEFVDQFVAADRRRPMKAALRMLVADEGQITSDMIERTLAYKRSDGVAEALQALGDTLTSGRVADGAEDDLAAVTARILVVWGAEDRVLPAFAADRLGDRAEVRVIEGAGHMPQMEAASEVSELLSAHMEGAG